MDRIAGIGGRAVAIVGGLFLIAAMVLTVANVIARIFGEVITGAYELTGVLIVVVASTAMAYAAVQHTHVVVDVVVCKFPKRIQGLIDTFTAILGLGVWSVITWQSISILVKRWNSESTELLEVPFYPFRILWVLGLVFLCFALIRDIRAKWRTNCK